MTRQRNIIRSVVFSNAQHEVLDQVEKTLLNKSFPVIQPPIALHVVTTMYDSLRVYINNLK